MKNFGERIKKFNDEILNAYLQLEDLIKNYLKVFKKVSGKESEDQHFIDSIHKNKVQIMSSGRNIVVIGETNVGKSTFINLLLGKDLLPEKDTTETGVLTVIKPPDLQEKKAIVTFHEKSHLQALMNEIQSKDEEKDSDFFHFKRMITILENNKELQSLLGRPPIEMELSSDVSSIISSLREYTSINAKEQKHYVVKQIEIYYDTLITDIGFSIADSPGLNDRNPLRSFITQSHLYTASVILYIFEKGGIKGNTFNDFKYIFENKLADKLIIIINKIDGLKENLTDYLTKFKKDLISDILERLIFSFEKNKNITPEEKDDLIAYSRKIIENVDIFPLSATEVRDCRLNNSLDSIYYKQYVSLIENLEKYLISDEYLNDRSKRLLDSYGLIFSKFENQINKSVKALVDNNLQENIDNLNKLENLEKSIDNESATIFLSFRRNLIAEIDSEVRIIKNKYENICIEKSIDAIRNGDIAHIWPQTRKKKAKELLEYSVQPIVQNNIRAFESDLNREINKIINKKVKILSEDFSKMLSRLYAEINIKDQGVIEGNISTGLQISEITVELLNLIGGAVLSITPLVISAVVGAIIFGPISLGMAIVTLIGGAFTALIARLIEMDISMNIKGIYNGEKIKNNMIKDVSSETTNIFLKACSKIDSSKVAEELISQIKKEIKINIAVIKEPLILSIKANGDTGITQKFQDIKSSISILKSIFEKINANHITS